MHWTGSLDLVVFDVIYQTRKKNVLISSIQFPNTSLVVLTNFKVSGNIFSSV